MNLLDEIIEAEARRSGTQFRADAAPGDQDSIEWLYERTGFCTASRFKDVLAVVQAKGKEAAARRNYRIETAVSRLTERPQDHFVSYEMQWGIEHEAEARMAYEAHAAVMVDQVGFIRHQMIEWCGGSPDGLIGEDGGIEIKCPTTPTHVTTLMSKVCEHLPQIQGLMWITGRSWWDFISWDPRMPPGLKLYVQRIERDDKYIAALAAEVERFLDEVAEQVTALHRMAATQEVMRQSTTSAAQPEPSGAPPSPDAPAKDAEAGAAESRAADRDVALQEAIDGLAKHKSIETLALYGDSLDLWIREDQRFMKAMRDRLAEIGKAKK